jgi:hypothetical protein
MAFIETSSTAKQQIAAKSFPDFMASPFYMAS